MPIRFRLLTGFVAAMAVLLTAVGVFVYWRVRIDLDSALNRNLNEEFTTTLALVGPDGHVAEVTGPGTAPPTREHQTLAADGTVVSSGPGVGDQPLLDTSDLRRAIKEPIRVDTGALLRTSPRPFRLLAKPIDGHGSAAILVVGIERDQHDEALRELLATLALAGVGALLVAGLVGERLAHAAFAPVERYRSQAAAIANGATGTRLDVPAARDDELAHALGHTFNDVLGALERAVERERRFVDDASHELRTPLTLMSARVQLLRRRNRTVEQHEQALAELQTEINDLIALSDQLLDLGAVTDALPSVPDDPVDLQAVVDAMCLSDVGVAVESWGSECSVTVPAMQIRQAIGNLVANARTHGRPPVTLTVRLDGGIVVVAVTDAGPGFAAGDLATATERFHRADDARSRPGTGLGLALVHAIVRRHHGELRICSHGIHHRVDAAIPFPCEHPDDGATVAIAFALLDNPDGRPSS